MDTRYQSELFSRRAAEHKMKPTQFTSVDGGKQKRLEFKIRQSRGWRESVFDNGRDLVAEPRSESPVRPLPVQSEAQLKLQQRLERLEKWKAEKEKARREQAQKKKKPFLFGIAHEPLNKCIPPPPDQEPRTSGRVTRSKTTGKPTKQKSDGQPATKFNVPKNAKFRPRLNVSMMPTLVIDMKPKENSRVNGKLVTSQHDLRKPKTDLESSSKPNINFKPVKDTAHTRSARLDARNARKIETDFDTIFTIKVTKSTKKLKKTTKKSLQNSKLISSDLEEPQMPSQSSTNTKSQGSPILPVAKTPRKSTGKSVQITPTNVVPRSESTSEEKLRSPKDLLLMTQQQFVDEVTMISPSVTLSRGKDKARKEMKKKLDEGLLDEYHSEDDSVLHYRRQLSAEIARMTAFCDNWDDIYETTSLPDFVQELILAACGNARLLMSSKMRQFAGLVERCAAGEGGGAGAGRIMPTDLDGFWDLVSIQIKKVDVSFEKLEQLRLRDWAEEAPAPAVTAMVAPPAAGAAKRRAARKPAPAQSRIKAMIAAARRAAQQPPPAAAAAAPAPATPPPASAEKSFEAGFFCVRSPVRSPARTPARTPPRAVRASLLKCVLSSEAKKATASKNSASYAMQRASLLSKDIDIEGISPLPQTPKLSSIDLTATPARSILKVTQQASVKKFGKQSSKTVLFFQDSDSEDADSSADKEKLKDVNTNSSTTNTTMEVDKDEKENRRQSKLVRQDAVYIPSPVNTRSQRKVSQTPYYEAPNEEKTPKRLSRKKVLQEPETNAEEQEKPRRKKSGTEEVASATPRRSGRRSGTEEVANATPRRSRRSKVVDEDLIDFATPPPVVVSKKRGKKSAGK